MVTSRRAGIRARRCLRCCGHVVLVTTLVVAGCAPKRVIHRDGAARNPSAPPPAAEVAPPGPASAARTSGSASTHDLPAPEPRGPAGSGVPERTPASLTFGAEAAALAGEQLGKPYQWGASGPDRFDCSGLVQHVYGQLGVAMPRVSEDQARVGREVRRGELQAGDLVFFATRGHAIDHVGIYIGGDEFIHAPNRGTPVRTESLARGWWRSKYRMARRVR